MGCLVALILAFVFRWRDFRPCLAALVRRDHHCADLLSELGFLGYCCTDNPGVMRYSGLGHRIRYAKLWNC